MKNSTVFIKVDGKMVQYGGMYSRGEALRIANLFIARGTVAAVNS